MESSRRHEPGTAINASPFVGRERELAELRRYFDDAAGGRGMLAMVTGEPGIGKTALCERLAEYAAQQGGCVLVGHSYEEGSLSLPYLPFVEALRARVLALEPNALRDELGTVAPEIALIVPELRELLGVEVRAPGDPEEGRWRLLQAVVTFIRSIAATQPLLLVLEDLHWADRGSLDLLTHLARNLADCHLLIVSTYRDVEVDRVHPLSATLAELRRVSVLPRTTLRGLDLDEVQRLFAGMRGEDAPRELAKVVHDRTEGSPLFVQEILRNLAEEDVARGNTAADGASLGDGGIPEGLHDVIGRRLSRLSSECNQMLASAAVIGREFNYETLQRVCDLEGPSLERAVEEAESAGILQDQSRPGALKYRFAHALFRQTLYEEISTPRRLRQHQKVARALEAQFATHLAEHASELAEHFSQSTNYADLAKASEYGEMAAGVAMSVFAFGEAVGLLERALETSQLADSQDKAHRASLLFRLGELMSVVGESPSRRRADFYLRALALYEEIGDESGAAQMHASLGFFYSLGPVAKLTQSRIHLETAVRLRAGGPADATMLQVQVTLARLAWLEMHTYEGLRLSLSAMEMAEELGNEVQWTAAAVVRGQELIAAGEVGEGFKVLARIRRRVDEMSDTRAQTQAGLVSAAPIGAASFLLADPKSSLACYDYEVGHPRYQAAAQGPGYKLLRAMRAAALALTGELEDAIEITDDLPDTGGPMAPGYAHPFVALWGGDWPRSESLWRKERELNEGRGNRWSAATFGAWLAKVLLIRGEVGGAERLLTSLLETGKAASNVLLLMIASAELALICASQGRVQEALPYLAGCREVLEKGENWRGITGRVALAEAAVAVASGDLASGERHFASAIETFETYSLPWDRAEALHLWGLGLIRARRRPAGAVKLNAAIEVYREHGAGQAWIERIEADKQRLLARVRPASSQPDGLSGREVEVLRLVAAGKSNPQIADELVISLNTVQRHVSNILAKAALANRTEAATYAHRHGLS